MNPTTLRALIALAAIALAGGLTGCEGHFEQPATVFVGDAGAPPEGFFSGRGVGEACDDDGDCRSGLGCVESECRATGQRALDERCLLTDECGDADDGTALQCGWSGFCVAAGDGGVNAECTSSSDCDKGMWCQLTGGVSGYCTASPADGGDIGDTCGDTSDCLAGLVCSPVRGECTAGSVLLNPDLFRGVACPTEAEAAMEFGVRHVIPRSGDSDNFYSLPFPNDARTADGRIDLSDHPVPGPAMIGSDPVAEILTALSEEMQGWSVNTPIYFRFTRPVDEASLEAGTSLRLINLDTGADHPFEFRFIPERNKYICANHLFMHPLWSQPLAPGARYAALVMKDVTEAAAEGAEAAAAEGLDDLATLLGDDEPGDADEKKAWQAYAPLRGHIKDGGVRAADIAGAAVFTTEDPRELMGRFREVARADEAPRLVGDPVLCEAGTTSPCATPNYQPPADNPDRRDSRDCPEEPSSNHYEIHARIRLPVFQNGERPYTAGGGELELDDLGRPTVLDHEEVCVAISIPKATMPPEGWPTLIYGHGTGGSFRNGIGLIAAGVSNIDLPDQGDDERVARFAMIGIDQPMHGPRQGGAGAGDLDPGPLFYNFNNPRGSKANLFQGAADNFSLVRFLQEFGSQQLEGPGEVRFDAGHIYYHGHSQGATTGPIFVANEPDVPLVLLSGVGGSLIFGILDKKEPYDGSVGLRLALQELEIDEFHPVVNFFQFYFDEADPLIYAPMLVHDPPAGAAAKHLMQVFGANDNFTPTSAQEIFASGTRTEMVLPDPIPDWWARGATERFGMATTDLPVSQNFATDDGRRTAFVIQHLNNAANSINGEEYDGHFVIYRDRTAIEQAANFLATGYLDGVPLVR